MCWLFTCYSQAESGILFFSGKKINIIMILIANDQRLEFTTTGTPVTAAFCLLPSEGMELCLLCLLCSTEVILFSARPHTHTALHQTKNQYWYYGLDSPFTAWMKGALSLQVLQFWLNKYTSQNNLKRKCTDFDHCITTDHLIFKRLIMQFSVSQHMQSLHAVTSNI